VIDSYREAAVHAGVVVMLRPSAVCPVSIIPEPPQFVTSACCTSTCQFRNDDPVGPAPGPCRKETVSCSIVIGSPRRGAITHVPAEAITYGIGAFCRSTVAVRPIACIGAPAQQHDCRD